MFFCPYIMRGTFTPSQPHLDNCIEAPRNFPARRRSDRYATTLSQRCEMASDLYPCRRQLWQAAGRSTRVNNDTSAQSQSEREQTVADNEGGSSVGGVVRCQCGLVKAHSGLLITHDIDGWKHRFFVFTSLHAPIGSCTLISQDTHALSVNNDEGSVL